MTGVPRVTVLGELLLYPVIGEIPQESVIPVIRHRAEALPRASELIVNRVMAGVRKRQRGPATCHG